MYDTIVIGAGQSGLVSGYFLKQQQLSFTILEKNVASGGAWQHYYESLKLYSPAKYATLPGLSFPGDPKRYPTRNEVINYLQQYAAVHELPIEYGITVQTVEKTPIGFRVITTAGETYEARTLISASGPFNTPYVPNIPGREGFGGNTLHAYDYRNPAPYRGQHVVVVGSRDSAMQIAYDLASVAQVSMAVRHDLRFMPKYVLGKSLFFWLHDTGYDRLPIGLFKKLAGSDKIIGYEPYRSALEAGNPAPKPMFTRFTETGVVWGDGAHEDVDTVIFATGYKQGLGYLADLGALDEDGRACHHDGVSQHVPGLYYVGLFGQRSHASATLRGVGGDARRTVERVARYLPSQDSVPRPRVTEALDA